MRSKTVGNCRRRSEDHESNYLPLPCPTGCRRARLEAGTRQSRSRRHHVVSRQRLPASRSTNRNRGLSQWFLPPTQLHFDPETIAVLTAAYQNAINGQSAAVREIIAKHIIALGCEGARESLERFLLNSDKARCARPADPANENGGRGLPLRGANFDPETIAVPDCRLRKGDRRPAELYSRHYSQMHYRIGIRRRERPSQVVSRRTYSVDA